MLKDNSNFICIKYNPSLTILLEGALSKWKK